jgi:hypothetical protein
VTIPRSNLHAKFKILARFRTRKVGRTLEIADILGGPYVHASGDHMFTLPIVNFSRKFHFQMPGYDNDPRNVGLPFDPAVSQEQAMGPARKDD